MLLTDGLIALIVFSSVAAAFEGVVYLQWNNPLRVNFSRGYRCLYWISPLAVALGVAISASLAHSYLGQLIGVVGILVALSALFIVPQISTKGTREWRFHCWRDNRWNTRARLETISLTLGVVCLLL